MLHAHAVIVPWGEVCQGRVVGAPWQQAWQQAMFGPRGFWATQQPTDHFRTSVGPAMAEAMLQIARSLPDRRPAERLTVVDVGAGDGQLLQEMAARSLGGHLRLIAVDVRPRPQGLPESIEWVNGDAVRVLRALAPIRGLVMAHEWLDEIPCPVVQVDGAGVIRLVHVEPESGAQSLQERVSPEQQAWLDRWWPLREPGTRAEIGLPRDRAWQKVRECIAEGVLLATDYDAGAHPPRGTLTAYREGRHVRPVPDGSCAITAHVLLSSCAAAIDPPGEHLTQREALGRLGLVGALPDPSLTPATEYGAALHLANDVARLRHPRGLGSFGWIVHDIG